jgi:tetratricopeptide (TPR) repeat protein
MVAAVTTRPATMNAPSRGTWRALVAAAALIAGAAGAYWGLASVVADRHLLRGYEAAQNNDPVTASHEFRAALGFRGDNYYRLLYAQKIGELATRRGEAGLPYLEEMRAGFRFLDDFPSLRGLTAEARLLHAWGANVDRSALEESLALYDRARLLTPPSSLLYAENADALVSAGCADEALALLEPLVPLDPQRSEFWGSLALVQLELGHDEEAQEAVDVALTINPDDPRANQASDLLNGTDPVID